jgi:cell division protein ZapE
MSSQKLITLYKAKIEGGVFKPDPAQEAAVQSLQRLFDQISPSPPAKREGGEGAKDFARRLLSPLTLSLSPLKKHGGEGMKIKGLYLHGGVGRGKSMLMDLFYESLPPEIPAQRVHFHEFMIGVHDYLHARRESDGIREGVDATLPLFAARIAEKTRVLCFDEFHVTDVADAMILGRLFRCLFEHGVVVVATSNWPLARLYEGGLQRDRFLPFIALMQERLESIDLGHGTDYRRQFIMQAGTYFAPLGRESAAQANSVFDVFTGKAPLSEEHFSVKGREIIARAAKGAAKFSFSQLCEQPMGAEDYLKIAQSYHTVFLENVPTLGYDRRNEAKRLMILIDALYEAKTRLIMTADAHPEKLYRGHDHAFEFERTISRLKEMQSAEYGCKA